MAEAEMRQNQIFPDGAARLVLEGHWRLHYFNIGDEAGPVTDIVLVPRDSHGVEPSVGHEGTS